MKKKGLNREEGKFERCIEGIKVYEGNSMSYFANLLRMIQNVSQSGVVALNRKFPVLQVLLKFGLTKNYGHSL